MFEKYLGKKKSIQRSLVRSFNISVISVIIFTFIEFSIFIVPSINSHLININAENVNKLIYAIRKFLGLTVSNIILISIILIKINTKKILQPLMQINEATKKVTEGDYDIELETKREDEVGELAYNFNKMTKELKSTENLQKEFINNVSHEIKTPISSIEGFAKLLKDPNLPYEEREEYSDIIIEEAERLSNLSGKMLKLAKLHNQEIIINKKEILIAEQIRRAISLLEPKWAEKNIKINVNLEECVFLGDEELIFQVWVNLLDNAIKFSKKDGKIDVKVFKENNKANIRIRDYGIGMKEDDIEKVFERFYQIDKSHSEEGSGLGLAIVKRIIELSKGEIEIKSKENKGTSVIIKLPINNEKSNKIIID